MVYGLFKDLPQRTTANKALCDKAFNIVKNPKYYGYQDGLASIVYKFFKSMRPGLPDCSKLPKFCWNDVLLNFLTLQSFSCHV